MNRQEQRERSRAAILRAASEQFIHHGYAATSLGDVAASLGLVRGTVHFHFATKERLGEAIVALLEQAYEDARMRATAEVDDAGAAARRTLELFTESYAGDVRLRAALRIAADASDHRAIETFLGRLVDLFGQAAPRTAPDATDAATTRAAWLAAAGIFGVLTTSTKAPAGQPLPRLVLTMWDALSEQAFGVRDVPSASTVVAD